MLETLIHLRWKFVILQVVCIIINHFINFFLINIFQPIDSTCLLFHPHTNPSLIIIKQQQNQYRPLFPKINPISNNIIFNECKNEFSFVIFNWMKLLVNFSQRSSTSHRRRSCSYSYSYSSTTTIHWNETQIFIQISMVRMNWEDTFSSSFRICQIDLHFVHVLINLVIKNDVVHHVHHRLFNNRYNKPLFIWKNLYISGRKRTWLVELEMMMMMILCHLVEIVVDWKVILMEVMIEWRKSNHQNLNQFLLR